MVTLTMLCSHSLKRPERDATILIQVTDADIRNQQRRQQEIQKQALQTGTPISATPSPAPTPVLSSIPRSSASTPVLSSLHGIDKLDEKAPPPLPPPQITTAATPGLLPAGQPQKEPSNTRPSHYSSVREQAATQFLSNIRLGKAPPPWKQHLAKKAAAAAASGKGEAQAPPSSSPPLRYAIALHVVCVTC